MKILLFNDNPVVRKLVALSAQKTKDDLSVAWSEEEVEEGKYDLLIIDDALYNDEMFESLNLKIVAKNKLYMATRGNPIPKGFDHVINKPFLPTDLVDMFVQIENNVGEPEMRPVETPVYSINLEDALPDIEGEDNKAFEADDGEEFDLDGFSGLDDNIPESGILDKEEVQEVQDLLEDTEEDEINGEDIFVQGIEESDFDEDAFQDQALEESAFEEEVTPDEIKEEFSFDDEILQDEIKGEILNFDDILEDETLKLEEDDFEESSVESEPVKEEDNEESLDLELPLDLDTMENEEEWDASTLDEMDISSLMDDHELENLGSTIEEAVDGLEESELERELSSDDFGFELDETLLDGLTQEGVAAETASAGDFDGLDELDMLDENELKRAIGEAVEEEFEETSDNVFETDTAVEEECEIDATEEVDEDEKNTSLQQSVSQTEGVEALQALLKALSNEEVAKSLKGMNISININFGNEK
jgi:uncharacterized membrane protein